MPGGVARGRMNDPGHTHKIRSCGARGESRVVPPLPVVEPGRAPRGPPPGLPSYYVLTSPESYGGGNRCISDVSVTILKYSVVIQLK